MTGYPCLCVQCWGLQLTPNSGEREREREREREKERTERRERKREGVIVEKVPSEERREKKNM